MLIPIGQEDDSVRRVPWVTIGIIAACVLMHLYISSIVGNSEKKIYEITGEFIEYFYTHPYLEMDEELQKTFQITDENQELLKSLGKNKYNALPDEETIAEEQALLDQLAQDLKDTIKEIPYFKFGFIPAKKTFFGLIAHMFVHGGWLHLIFNLLYLYIMGPFVEDVWGKPVYAAFYFITGIIAASGFAMHYPNFAGPLIGASGAISGVMGGFVVRFWHARIRYFWMFSIIFRGTFSAPAWLMLPVGFAMDFLSAILMDSAMPEGGGGVAHWAHVWGFIAGVALAFLIKYLRIEEKYVAPKIQTQVAYVNKSYETYEAAMQLLTDGEKEKAYNMLMDVAHKESTNQDVIEALWNLAPEMGNVNDVTPYLKRLIEREVQQNRMELALMHFRFLREKTPDASLSINSRIALFEQSVNFNDREEASELLNEVKKDVNESSPPGYLLNFSSATLKYDLAFNESIAPQIVGMALQHPDIPQELKDSLEERLSAVSERKEKNVIKVNSAYESGNIHQNSSLGGLTGAATIATVGSAFSTTRIETSSSSKNDELPPIPIPSEVKNSGFTEGSTWQQRPVNDDLPLIANPYQNMDKRESSLNQPPPLPVDSEIYIPIEPQDPVNSFQQPDQPPPIPQDIIESSVPPPEALIPIPISPELSSPPPLPSEQPISPPPLPIPTLRVTNAIPLGLKERKIALDLDNLGQRLFSLEKIKGIAVVKISPPGERPYLLIDLLVDELTSKKDVIRLIRLSSTSFNPQKIVPSAPGPLDAFRVFTSGLLKMTGAYPFPDLESVELKKVATYSSIQEYENSIIKAGSI